MKDISSKIDALAEYATKRNFPIQIAILFDVSRSTHLRRLWVVDMSSRKVLEHCLAASGRGRTVWSRLFPRTGDEPDSWLTPIGHCRVAERYEGEFGIAYRLDGLDESNANVRRRAIVIHSSPQIPEKIFSIMPLWCSRGCVVVSPESFRRIDALLQEHTDALLWIYND